MRRAMMILSAGLMIGLPMAGTGCVPQDQYDETLKTHKAIRVPYALLRPERF